MLELGDISLALFSIKSRHTFQLLTTVIIIVLHNVHMPRVVIFTVNGEGWYNHHRRNLFLLLFKLVLLYFVISDCC